MENNASERTSGGKGVFVTGSEAFGTEEDWLQGYDTVVAQSAHENDLNQQRRSKRMTYDQKDNAVSLFKNEERASEKHPHYSGKGLVDGKEWRVAMWKNTSKNGKVYLSLKFEEPREKVQAASTMEDDVPF
jgi:uncharacterized protein (DUF736 family)